jgi:hypothetical protein
MMPDWLRIEQLAQLMYEYPDGIGWSKATNITKDEYRDMAARMTDDGLIRHNPSKD